MLYPGTAITALTTYHSRLREQSFALDDFACEHNALPETQSIAVYATNIPGEV